MDVIHDWDDQATALLSAVRLVDAKIEPAEYGFVDSVGGPTAPNSQWILTAELALDGRVR
jgi:hypothetical protein